MSAGDASQFAGMIVGALVCCVYSLAIGDELLITLLLTFIGAVVGAAVGFAAYMVVRS